MERNEAVVKLKKLQGCDLRQLANEYSLTVWKAGRLNKGWAGHVLERYLGLPLNSNQSPDFGTWELKIIPLKRLRSGIIVPKETMAITMISAADVLQKEFEQSHLLAKLRKMIVCARIFESNLEESSLLEKVKIFNLSNPVIYNQVKIDYDLVRETIKQKGFPSLTGKLGIWVQPRTKGPGNGSTTRAFYARKNFINYILNSADEFDQDEFDQ